ncbi:LacI family transcriptional regulator [Clavibacter michiganensis subsp. michiganensis]|uniref:LacI family DNA-binding transcriptional regulator n=1 Tax=Clavibacter michiganensis TaxID=28447 RepID=UPI001365985B|nr:LacI family DNA-binding transcriptional regulator [Clavibacter michiganensis]MWJ79525.1 LacI family transcriptional regulator [Clavibacter michiganensis subsp. michiganensis]
MATSAPLPRDGSRPRGGSLPRGQVTRSDVARYAGVSTAVVSYVVNSGPRPVAEATAERVRDAIRVLGYRPNASARALRTGSTQMLGLVVPEIGNPLFAEMAIAVEQCAARRGHAVLLVNSESDPQVERTLIRSLTARQVDGIIISTVQHGSAVVDLPTLGVPVVLLNTFRAQDGVETVGVDAREGARLGVEHLIGHGHARIGLIIGGGGEVEAREHGWQDATRAAGLPDGPLAREPFTREGGYRGALRLFGGSDRPTALFASSDMQAIGTLRALGELGLRVPEDVAVLSFDGTDEAEYAAPRLTVVRQPVEEMAEEAVARLIAPDPDRAPHHASFTPTLVIGRSCGCAAPAEGTATTAPASR